MLDKTVCKDLWESTINTESLAIEDNSLTLSDVEKISNKKTIMGKKKEIQEVKNAYGAYAQISIINPYDIEELKRIHAIMTIF